MHLLIGAVALAGAAVFVAASWYRRLPLSFAPVVIVWALAAAWWPDADSGARSHPFDIALWVLTVALCAAAVAHTSRTRDQQSSPIPGGGTGWRRPR